MRVICLSKRWKHHTVSGGYDRLAREVGASEVRRIISSRVLSKSTQYLRRALLLHPPHILDYRYEDLQAEQELAQTAKKMDADIAHVLYGDEQLDFLLQSEDLLPCPLVVSFHLLTHRAKARLNALGKKKLSRIDSVILVASYQLQDFLEWFPADRLHYVPHGIDTNQFVPGEQRHPSAILRMLTVGGHMRDWTALEKIMQSLRTKGIDCQLDVVGGQAENERAVLEKFSAVKLHERISEEELVKLYQNADVLVLPVTSATANNSVLESLACGTPVISNATGGMPDYIDEASGWLFSPGDIDGMVDLIIRGADDRNLFESKRAAARAKALEFSWPNVAQQVQAVYRMTIERRTSISP